MESSLIPELLADSQLKASLGTELHRESERLKLLLDMTNTLVSNLELRDLLRAISASIRKVMHCDIVGVWLPDADPGQMRQLAMDFPEGRGFLREDSLRSIAGTNLGIAFTNGKSVVVPKADLMSDQEILEQARSEGIQSGLALPLISRDRTLGVLTLARRTEDAFSPDDIDFLMRAAGQGEIAVENGWPIV